MQLYILKAMQDIIDRYTFKRIVLKVSNNSIVQKLIKYTVAQVVLDTLSQSDIVPIFFMQW